MFGKSCHCKCSASFKQREKSYQVLSDKPNISFKFLEVWNEKGKYMMIWMSSFPLTFVVCQGHIQSKFYTGWLIVRIDSWSKLHQAFAGSLWWFVFFKNLYYQKQCKFVMNIGLIRVRGAPFRFFLCLKNIFHISVWGFLQFLK